MSRTDETRSSSELRAVDVAIIGGGPAGGAAALELAGRGLSVAVVEKAVPPRYKTCGGGVLRRALKRLPIDVRAAVERECRTAELVWHAPNLRLECRREYPIVSMVMRDRFDHLILQAALARGDVRLLAGTTVQKIVTGPDAVHLATSAGDFSARFVIAADGVNSTIARQTGLPALTGVVPALEAEAVFDEPVMDTFVSAARFDFGVVPAGYGWVFPKANHLSIGVGTARRGGVNLPAQYQQYLHDLGLPAPRTETRHGYMIPCRPRRRMFSIARILFAGDAAGLADPVTAEGITAGILSGQLAARAILGGQTSESAVRERYRATLQAELLADLRVARWLAWLLYERPRWCAVLLARHGAGMSELMTRIVTGESTYRTAVRRPAHYLRLLTPSRHP